MQRQRSLSAASASLFDRQRAQTTLAPTTGSSRLKIEKHPPFNCLSETPPPSPHLPNHPAARQREHEILVCPPHLHTHTPAAPLSPCSVTHPLFFLPLFSPLPTLFSHTAPPSIAPSFSCFYPQSPLIKKTLTLHETGETTEGYILHFPRGEGWGVLAATKAQS